MTNSHGPILERTTFEFSRGVEYFDVRELQTMTGQDASCFPDVILKELLDNALDAAESAGAAPNISVRLRHRGRLLLVTVRDNGSGIEPGTVAKVLNFQTRTSDKAAYRSPTRGLQGNALKTVVGIPRALGVRAPVYVEARGIRHRIVADIDPAGEVRVRHDSQDVPHRQGTLVGVALPIKRCGPTDFAGWARAFSLFNPHALVRIRNHGAERKQAYADGPPPRNSYRPTVAFPGGGWRKFLPTDLTSPWWYDEAALAKLVFGHVSAAERGGRDLTLRDLVRQFRGLSGTAKAKAVCDRFPGVKRLADFLGRELDVARLLEAMRSATEPPSPNILGQVGEDHFRRRFDRWYGVKRWWYKKVAGAVAGVPYVIEVALAETAKPGRLFHGANFSPTFDDPLIGTVIPGPEFTSFGLAGFLECGHARPGGATRTAAAFHLICPVLETLDKGKTRLMVPRPIGEAAGKALWSVVKDLYREEERRRKDAARQARADRAHERAAENIWNLKSAVFAVIPEAVRAAAGELDQVSAHTLFYHVRPLIQTYTDRELSSDYFEQTLLPAYRREVGPIPEVYYEPRGTLYEPHTGKAVPLGTREVDQYTFPSWLYDKILFVEKKGLWPVFEAARLAERYDMAIIAGEGFATEACRVLFSNARHDKDYQLFVLHDADPWGYNIARTLREETVRMPGHRVEVIDLGLCLAAALELGLPAEEFTRKKQLPRGLALNDLEREYFEGRGVGPRSWICRRVELNAFSTPGLIAYTESGLREAGVRGKVIPPPDALLGQAEDVYRQALGAAVLDVLDCLLGTAALKDNLADQFRQRVPVEQARVWVEQAFAQDGSLSWKRAVSDRVATILRHHRGDLEAAVRAALTRESPDLDDQTGGRL
jgi:hypothetical protein